MQFPILKDNQVTLIRAEKATGHVLDENYLLFRKDNPKVVHSIFSSLEEAKKYITGIEAIRDDVEFVVYDKDEKVLLYTNPL